MITKKRKMAILLAGFLAFANMTACAEETEREDTSRKAAIVVISITGNELTYYEVEDESEEALTEEKTKADEEAITEAETKTEKNQKDFEPEKGMAGGMAHKDTKTVYLPVAAPVHTDTDETMTFSILEEGDELEVLLEEKDGEEIITEIWLLNTADASVQA